MAVKDPGLPGFHDLLLGQTESLPAQESNSVKIFMSSTFTDMKEERNKLIREVFPELRHYCQQRGLEFEVVDMRWGVRDSATADHLTSALCLCEIDKCKRLSQGPYFVGFLGDKYGYRPLRSTIDSQTFEKLMELVSSHDAHDAVTPDDVDLVKTWYIQDTNAIPAMYVLQPITRYITDYYQAGDEEKQSEARKKWWDIFDRMRAVFDVAAKMAVEKGVFSEEEMHTFVMSVTEEEIRHGLQDNNNIGDTCLFFCRDFQGLSTSSGGSGLSRLTDVIVDPESGKVELEEHSQAMLSKLKTEYISSVVPSESLYKYSVPWNDKGIDPSLVEHATYLSDMCRVFESKMKAMIDKRQARRSKVIDSAKFSLYKELLHHSSFCETKCSAFQGREDVLTTIQSYLTAHPGKPLVVHGVSGSGKTSVMAMVARRARQWLGEGCVMVLRFLGTSAQSSSIHETLQSMCKQILLAYGVVQPVNKSMEDFSELVQMFNHLIRHLPTKEKPLLLLFDSIDQLNSNNNAHQMNWLLKCLPQHTPVVVSMLPVEHNCLANIRKSLPDPKCYVEMEPVPKATGIVIMEGWLRNRGRRLTPEQEGLVAEAFDKCPQPLFLKVLFEEFVTWPSFKSMEEIKLPFTVPDAITRLFEDLEDRHGQILVAHALGYLTAAKRGLTEVEIEDVLSCDDIALNDVYQYWDPPVEGVVRIPSSIWKRLRYDISEFVVERQAGGKTVIAWYHRQFIEAACRHYLCSAETRFARHRLLADLFLGEYSNGAIKPIRLERRGKDFPNADRQAAPQPLMFGDSMYNLRKLQELPHLLNSLTPVGSAPVDDMRHHVMFNFDWILTKLRGLSFLDLINDFPEYDEESSLLVDALYLSGSNLKEDPFSLAGQLIGRMADFVDRYPNIARLLDQAKSWVRSTQHSLMIPQSACLIPPGGQLKTSLAGHPSRVEAIACTKSAEYLITACKDGDNPPMANVWNAETAELIHTLQIRSSRKSSGSISLVIRNDDKCVIFGCQDLGMFEIASGESVVRFEADGDDTLSCLQINHDGSLAVAGCEKGTNVYVWDLQTGSTLAKLEHPSTVKYACFESTNKLLSVCHDGVIRLWSMESKECLDSIEGHTSGELTAMAHAVDIRTIITGAKDGIIKLTQYLESNALVRSLEGHKKSISTLLVLPDNCLASGSADFTVRIWDLLEGTSLLACTGHAGNITCLWYCAADPGDAGGKPFLVSGSKDDYLKVWDLAPPRGTGPLITTLEGHSSWIAGVTGSCHGQMIYSASNDKSAKVWDYRRESMTCRERHGGHAYSVIFTPDKSTVITSAEDQTVKFWRFSDGRLIRQEAGFLRCTEISRDGKKFIGALSDVGVVRVWEMDGGTHSATVDLEGHQKGIECLVWGRDDEVVTGSKDMSLKVWNIDTKTCRMTLEGHVAPITCLRTSMKKADSLIVSGDSKGMMKVWKYATGECLHSANEHKLAMKCLDVSHNGQYAVSGGGDFIVVLWSLREGAVGEVVRRLTIHTADIICLAFTHDDSRIVSGSHTGKNQLHVWNYLKEQDSDDYFLEGHNHAIMFLCITSDDKYLMTASRDCTLKAWHLTSGQMMTSFDCQSQIKFFSMAHVGDDHYRLAAGNKSGYVLLLDLLLPNADRTATSVQNSITHPVTGNNGIQSSQMSIPAASANPHDSDGRVQSEGDMVHTNQSNASSKNSKKSRICLIY